MQIPLPDAMQYVHENAEPYLNYSEFNKSPVHRVRLACIIRMLSDAALPGRDRVLEIGCGTGNVAIPIASLGYRVTACDIHKPSIESAGRRNPFANLQFAHGSIEQIKPQEYKVIVLTEVIEHVHEYREMIGRIAGAMRNDGTLILTVPNGWGITEVLCRPSYALKKWPGGAALIKVVKRLLKTADLTTANTATPHVRFFTLNNIAKLFESNNLAIMSFRRYYFLWPVWETFFSQRSCSAEWPERDFVRSQKLPPSLCAFWAFALQKKEAAER